MQLAIPIGLIVGALLMPKLQQVLLERDAARMGLKVEQLIPCQSTPTRFLAAVIAWGIAIFLSGLVASFE